MPDKIIPNKTLYCTIKQEVTQPKIKRIMNSYKEVKADFLTIGFWVSSLLAAVLAIPSIGIFIYILTIFDSITRSMSFSVQNDMYRVIAVFHRW